MNGVPTVEKPKLRYERHEAARSAPCWPWTKLPILPGSGVCSPILRLGLGDAGRLTAAAASCAGSPWPPPLVGRSAPGSGKSVGDQDWRPPLGAIPRQASEVLSRDFDANSNRQRVGRGQRPWAPGPETTHTAGRGLSH